MSDLTEAMREAVASVPDPDVEVLDLAGLPPIRHRPYQSATVGDLLGERGGQAWKRGWEVATEVLRLVLLFWGSAIAVGFFDTLSDQGMDATTMLLTSLATTAVLRGVLAIRGPEL